jgi:PhzF family phenazine biosynthesis protein
MAQTIQFKQVDVFSTTPFSGNPLAVILDGSALSDAQMQAIARWTNLSETTFVLPPQHPGADYRVRIFTVEGELPFAGHPTLGTAHALLEAGHQTKTPGRMVQECGVGLVNITISADGELAFAAPEATLEAWAHSGVAAALSSDAFDMQQAMTIVDMGIRWLLVPMASAQAVLDIRPDVPRLAQLLKDAGVTGVMPFGPASDGEVQYEVRGLLVEQGALTEDPITGSANACLARYLAAQGQAHDYLARQGTAIQRNGRVSVQFRDDGIWIGGQTLTVIDGTLAV